MSKIIKEKLTEYFDIEKQTTESIFHQLFLYVCSQKAKSSTSDLYILAKLLSSEDILKIINYFDGDILKIPTKTEFRNATLVSLCFYLKEIKGWDWSDIKTFINLPENDKHLLSSISIGRQINNLKLKLKKDILKMLKSIEVDNFEELVKNFKYAKGYFYEQGFDEKNK